MELYAQPNLWLNDPRLLYHEGIYYLFHLQGPRDLPKPPYEEMALATSTDLLNWQTHPLLLKPGAPGEWDDVAIYTSGYIHHEGRFYTLYTGLGSAEQGRVQRIGLASSTDLVEWERHPANPVLEADPHWYEADPDDAPTYNHVGWRDPWLWQHPDDGMFYAFITARENHGPGETRGCIALAKSIDLIDWECLPPCYAPQTERDHEVSELIPYRGKWLIIFGSYSFGLGMRYIVSDDPLQWDSGDLGKPILGSEALMEYSLTTAPAVHGEGRDAVHLVYEWHPDHPDHPRVRGRVALPKTLAGDFDDIHLRMRDDIAPCPDCCMSLDDMRQCGAGPWLVQGSAISLTMKGSATVPVAGRGARTVSARISAGDGSAGGFVLGDGEMSVMLHGDGRLVATTTAAAGERVWEVGPEGELALALVDRHAEVYFERRYLGTLCALTFGDKQAALRTDGDGTCEIGEVGVRPIPLS
ncbi:MAG TPA: hypothetical protein DGT21_23265 [Armatimonadetes bacterium]|jgi:beta-fructofuranosidase|nr:hypothetical protein [Armatimonadota bacterium]